MRFLRSIFFLSLYGLTAQPGCTVNVDFNKIKTMVTEATQQGRYYCGAHVTKDLIDADDPVKVAVDKGVRKENFIDASDYTEVLNDLAKKYPPVFYLSARYMFEWNNEMKKDSLIAAFFTDIEESFNGKKPHTQSSAHLATAGIAKPIEFFKIQKYQPQLVRAYLKERELMEQGYTVFYHGQRSHFGFSQTMILKILKKAHEQRLVNYVISQDFLFIRVPKPLRQFMMFGCLTEQQKNEQKELREKVIADECCDYYINSISVNGFLFAHSDFNLSSSWLNVADNTNEFYFDPEIVFKEFFEAIIESETDAHNVFYALKQQIMELRQEHEALFSKGRLLQIAIPGVLVNDCVYTSQGGSDRIKVELPGLDTVYDVKKIITYTLTHPTEKAYRVPAGNWGEGREIHFCLAATADMVLNPWIGIKLFGYDPDIDPKESDRYQKYLDDCDALALTIAKSLTFL